jgi:hypothetical protein
VADSWVPTEEWDNGGAFDWCGHPDEFEEWEDRAACDSSGKEIRLPVFECLCAEAGGKQCDMDADTDGTALCPTGCNVTVASPPYEDTMMPIIDRITVLEQVSGCHDPSAMGGGDEFVAATMESVSGPPEGAYRFAWRSDDAAAGMHMNGVGFAANKGCLVVWSGDDDIWSDEKNAPVRLEVGSVLDLHKYLMETPSPEDPSITVAAQLMYLDATGYGADDRRFFDEFNYQEFYVWAAGCPADDVCDRDGVCTCGAPPVSPCKVDPIRMDEVPEIVCCTDSLMSGRNCDDSKCPAGVDAVRDASGNIITPAVPHSSCNREHARCEYHFTTRGAANFISKTLKHRLSTFLDRYFR